MFMISTFLFVVFLGKFSVSIEVNVEIIPDSWNILLKLTNPNDYDVHTIKFNNLLSPFLPRRVISSLDVTNPENPSITKFYGAVGKHEEPVLNDVLETIASKSTVEFNIDVSDLYRFEKDKKYEVTLKDELPIFTDFDGSHPVPIVSSSDERVQVSFTYNFLATKESAYPWSKESREDVEEPEEGSGRRWGHDTACMTKLQHLVPSLIAADEALTSAISYFNNFCNYGNIDGFTRFFGERTPQNQQYNWITAHMVFVHAKAHLYSSYFRCTAIRCLGNPYLIAYVYPVDPCDGDGMNIYLCPRFFTKPTSIDGSLHTQPGSIVHELTHFCRPFGSDTDDIEYGRSACETLANTNPSDALKNADSYTNFVETSRPSC